MASAEYYKFDTETKLTVVEFCLGADGIDPVFMIRNYL